MIPLSHHLQWEHEVGKRDRIFGVVIFIFNISFKNFSYVFVNIVQMGATSS